MPHNEQNISEYHAGDALELVVTVEDQDGDLLSITSAQKIEWSLKEDAFDPASATLLTKTYNEGQPGGGITITDGGNGEFVVKIETGDTEGMDGQHYHRARLTDSDGDRSTLFTGTLTIEDS